MTRLFTPRRKTLIAPPTPRRHATPMLPPSGWPLSPLSRGPCSHAHCCSELHGGWATPPHTNTAQQLAARLQSDTHVLLRMHWFSSSQRLSGVSRKDTLAVALQHVAGASTHVTAVGLLLPTRDTTATCDACSHAHPPCRCCQNPAAHAQGVQTHRPTRNMKCECQSGGCEDTLRQCKGTLVYTDALPIRCCCCCCGRRQRVAGCAGDRRVSACCCCPTMGRRSALSCCRDDGGFHTLAAATSR
jgi:hypothetical protein